MTEREEIELIETALAQLEQDRKINGIFWKSAYVPSTSMAIAILERAARARLAALIANEKAGALSDTGP